MENDTDFAHALLEEAAEDGVELALIAFAIVFDTELECLGTPPRGFEMIRAGAENGSADGLFYLGKYI